MKLLLLVLVVLVESQSPAVTRNLEVSTGFSQSSSFENSPDCKGESFVFCGRLYLRESAWGHKTKQQCECQRAEETHKRGSGPRE